MCHEPHRSNNILTNVYIHAHAIKKAKGPGA